VWDRASSRYQVLCRRHRDGARWDTEAGKGAINEDSMQIEAHEFDWSQIGVVYEANGVTVTSFPSCTR